MKAQQEGFLYMDVLASLFVMSLLCSTLFVLMMSSIQQYRKMMEEDRTLQAMILYMEEGKASWADRKTLSIDGNSLSAWRGNTSIHYLFVGI